MSARPRCANCRKAFTPNYRNRTKLTGRQKVCADCGPVIGHRLADKRYREDTGRSRRKRSTPGVPSNRPRATAPPSVSETLTSSSVAAATAAPGNEFAARVGHHLVAIAALVNGSRPPDGCEALKPVPIGIFEESRRPIARPAA